jgi:hypothetical protein
MTTTPGIGDNRPALITNDMLAIDHRDLEARVAELEAKADTQPTEVNDDETQGRLQDVIKAIDGAQKTVETTRVSVKEDFLKAERVVDGFFKQGLGARLGAIRVKLEKVATSYLQRKQAAERRRREEEARRLREEEEEQRRIAREAEERAARLRERSRPAQAAAIEQDARDAAAEAAELEAQRIAAEQHAQAKPAELARTRSSEGGSLGTLKSTWDFNIEAMDEIPAGPLWAYIKREAKEQAIRAYIKANAPTDETTTSADWQPLRGVKMFRTAKGVYR